MSVHNDPARSRVAIERLIGSVASSGQDEWSQRAVNEICDSVNASDSEARSACRVILRNIESGYPMPQVPLIAIQLWDTMACSCPIYFAPYTIKSRFMNTIKQVVLSPATFGEVRDRILETLWSLEKRLSNPDHRRVYRSTWDQLRTRLSSSAVSGNSSIRPISSLSVDRNSIHGRPTSANMELSVPPAPIIQTIGLPGLVSPLHERTTRTDSFHSSVAEVGSGGSARHASRTRSSAAKTNEKVKRWLRQIGQISPDTGSSPLVLSYNELPLIDLEEFDSGPEYSTAKESTPLEHIGDKFEDLLDDSVEKPTPEVFDDIVRQGCPDLSGRVAIFLKPEQLNVEWYGADTYKGELHNGVKVAVKVCPWKFSPKARAGGVKTYEGLIRGFREWSNLGHENIHRLIGVVTVQGQLGMVLEWMEYETLQQYIRVNNGTDRCNLCLQVARGIEYLHRKEIIHGNLKASSILVSADGVVKLSNLEDSIRLGCTFIDAKLPWARHEHLRWMAPEVISESSRMHRKNYSTDVYALGGTFFEIMTGAEPWAQCHYHASIATKIIDKSLPERPAKDFPDDETGNKMWELVVRCWNYDPIARPSVREIVETLQTLPVIPGNGTLSNVEVQSRQMSSQDMFQQVVAHGCVDLSSQMDPTSHSAVAIHGGAIGDIFKGKLRGGLDIAVKVWRVSSVPGDGAKHTKRAMREIYHWSKIKHENIHELMGVVLWHGRLGMVSLWMEHGNLRDYLRKNPASNRYSLCSQVAAGVSHLHTNGMIHGDLKAINILVSKDGVAKISDFDHSILYDCTLIFSETTNLGGGTLRWMAPELLLSSEEGSTPTGRSKECDVYALGMTILEIITGRLPYAEYERDQGVLRALFMKKPPKQPEVLGGADESRLKLWRLLLNCWDHDPSVRPSANKIQELLENLVR